MTLELSDYLALGAIVVSLISTVIAVRLTRSQIHETTYEAATALFLEVDRALLQYPEVRCFFYEGMRLPPGDERTDRAIAVAELMLDVFEWIWHRQRGFSTDDRQGWESYIRDMFTRSDVLRNYHLLHAEWHPMIHHLVPSGS